MLRYCRRAVWLHQGYPGGDHPARHGRNPARCHHGRHHVPESTTNASTDTTTKPADTTTKKAKEDSGSAYTVNQALDALTNYYGKGYDVDGTVSEGNNYYFAVYKNKKKYASVKVNMQTGDAVETRTKDGATANFNVFV